ncbi:MAG: dihydrolipoamide acetyltransferase family protein [Candidatus Bathyarchaeia archaeon]
MVNKLKMPDVGEGVAQGEILKWMVKEGDQVVEGQPLVEVMTDKVNVEIPSPEKGTILKIVTPSGSTVPVGETMVVIGLPGEHIEEEPKFASRTENVVKPQSTQKTPHSAAPVSILATPATRKLARELNVDLASITSSGPQGRITDKDVRTAAERRRQTMISISEERIPFRGLRRRIAEKLLQAKQSSVTVTHVDQVDVTELVVFREKTKEKASSAELRITYLPFIIKAVVIGLKQFPYVNSSMDEDKQEIVLKRNYNIGIATATSEGLVVPVIRDADKKSILELARQIETLTQKARNGKLELSEIHSGTFTITNLGGVGGLFATPMLNHPEVAILGVHKIEKRPIVRDGGIHARDMMYLSLTFDHRVIDGSTAAEFTNLVIKNLENPKVLLEV